MVDIIQAQDRLDLTIAPFKIHTAPGPCPGNRETGSFMAHWRRLF